MKRMFTVVNVNNGALYFFVFYFGVERWLSKLFLARIVFRSKNYPSPHRHHSSLLENQRDNMAEPWPTDYSGLP